MKTLLVVFSLGFTSVAASAQSLLLLTDPLTSSNSNWTQNRHGDIFFRRTHVLNRRHARVQRRPGKYE